MTERVGRSTIAPGPKLDTTDSIAARFWSLRSSALAMAFAPWIAWVDGDIGLDIAHRTSGNKPLWSADKLSIRVQGHMEQTMGLDFAA